MGKMKDFKLKLILSALGGIIFSFIFILLTFVLPVKEKQEINLGKPKGKLQIISHSMKNR
jgi:hypothetical protein